MTLRFFSLEEEGNLKSEEKEVPKGFDRSLFEHRQRVLAAQAKAKPAKVLIKDKLAPVQKDVHINVRIYRPIDKDITHILPTLIYVPGTAYVAYETNFTDIICSHLCDLTGCQIIVPYHRLSPESQYPKPIWDVLGIINLIKASVFGPKNIFHIDINHFALAGYSSGANIAALATASSSFLQAHAKRILLVCPIVDLSRSLREFKEEFEEKDTTISNEFVDWFLKLYIPDGIDPRDPKLSPYWQGGEALKIMPPTTIMHGEFERFRSDAEGFYNKLKNCGVDVSKFMFEKENHAMLWYRLEVIEAMAAVLMQDFGLKKITTLPLNLDGSTSRNHLITIKPKLASRLEAKDEKEDRKVISAQSLAKL